MNYNVLLTITSLLAILLVTFHLSDDVVRGIEPGGFKNLIGIGMLVVWTYGALMLAGRRSGHVVMLLGSILGLIVPLAHMQGTGLVGGRIADSTGIFFWVWTLLTLELVATVALILAIRCLWDPEWAKSHPGIS